jgi:hypothetical protein
MKRLAAIAVATVTTIGLIPPANAATAAGAGIEVNGKYIGGLRIVTPAGEATCSGTSFYIGPHQTHE